MIPSEPANPLGRWGGRLTNRPLPKRDPSILALSLDDRHALAHLWLGRSAGERRVSESCAVIRAALVRRNAPQELVDLATRAIDDELRHAEIWRQGAECYFGETLPPPANWPLEVPQIDAPAAVCDSLFVLGQCVFNETTASVFLQTCLRLARGRLARAVLREVLADEIDHGRIGWAYLAWMPAPDRTALQPWLPAMVRAHLREWSRGFKDVPRVFEEHGIPSKSDTEAAIQQALNDVIRPGLAQWGLDLDAGKES